MRQFGRMPPSLFLIGTDGPQMFVPDSLADEAAKDDFATTARLICIAHAATACVMALEAWAKFAKPNEKLDLTEPPSEAFDRQEVIVLMGEDRAAQKQTFLPIVRSDNGNFFGFGEHHAPVLDQVQGRFAQILPPHLPAKKDRVLAQLMLQVKGATPAPPTSAPSRPRR